MPIRREPSKMEPGVSFGTRIKATDALVQNNVTVEPVLPLKEYVIRNACEFRAHLENGPRSQSGARWLQLLDAIEGELAYPVDRRTVATYLSSAAARKAAAQRAPGSGSDGGAGPSVPVVKPATDVGAENPFKGQR